MSDEKKKYEAVIVLNIQGEDGIEKLVKTVEKEMEGEGAKMDRIDQLGKKEFAYNARKQASGYYVNYYFEAAPTTISKIKTKLDLNTDIYLQHYQVAS
tara:strand:- start:6489 stop:6782 length:294 start_codon:yes stop_codon:yes gene_type:complete